MNKQPTLHKSAMIGFAALVLSILAFRAQGGPIVTNGSFNTPAIVTSSFQLPVTSSSNLPGWTASGASYDCLVFSNTATAPCLSGNTGSALWPGPITNPNLMSPDGGNFIAIDADQAYAVTLSQTINGLVMGQSYTLSFLQAASQFIAQSGATTEQWRVSFNLPSLCDPKVITNTSSCQTQDSLIMNNASQGFVPWMIQYMTFVAQGSTEVLSFFAVGGPGGLPPVALLDGVSVTAVPEPETLALLGIGLLGILVVRRQ